MQSSWYLLRLVNISFGWWQIKYLWIFNPIPGEMIHFDEHMGWFNHQGMDCFGGLSFLRHPRPKFTESFEQVLIYPQTAGRSMWALMHFLKKQRRCISFWSRLEMWKILVKIPICSMYGMFTYIYHKVEPNVRKISQWVWHFRSQLFVEFTSTFGNFNQISSD